MNPLKILKKIPCKRIDVIHCPVVYRRAEEGYSWNGKVLAIQGRFTEEWLHEVSHWHVASEKQRSRVEFGLGANAETKFREKANAARCVSKKECWRQEEEASMLQILLMREMGMDYRKTMDTHGWIDWVELEHNRQEALAGFKRAAMRPLKRLIKKKLIDKELNVLI